MAGPSSLSSLQEGAGLIARRYQKLADLGDGGMAHVYVVLDLTSGMKVALKRPIVQGSSEHQRRVHDLFAREFQALCQLAHPRIVEVYDYGVDQAVPYYTMEILDGGDLQQLVPVGYRRLCEIARDVCSALSLLHSRRIIHRDIGPRNVRCTTAGVAKLIDFGAMTHMGPSKEIVGTPAFCLDAAVAAGRARPTSKCGAALERVSQLGPEARELAVALALCPDESFGFDEARELAARERATALTRDIDALTQADITRLRAGRLMLADRAWIAPLLVSLTPDAVRDLHLRLARVFDHWGFDATFRRAQHVLRGGDVSRALDIFTAYAIESRKLTDSDPQAFRALMRSLPSDWFETYDEVIRLCDEFGRPKRDRFALLARLGALVGVTGINDRVHMPALLEELKQGSGLTHFEAADPKLDAGARLKAALEAAALRYEQLPDHERTVDPRQAIAHLAMCERFGVQAAAPALDLPLLRLLPSLQPFVMLAPAFAVAEKMRLGVLARVSGRLDLAVQTYAELIDRVAAPDGGGLDPTHVKYTRLFLTNALGIMQAGLGIGDCLARAEILDSEPMFRVNAAIVRMQHALWQGDSHGADRERKRVEERRIQSSYSLADHNHLQWQVLAYAAMEDLTRLKQTLMEIVPLAEKFAGWRPVELYGKAEYQRIRGDYASSLQLVGPALESTRAGECVVWAHLAAAQIRTLAGSGQLARSLELGEKYAQDARAAELGRTAEDCIALALDVARAKHGDLQAGPVVEAIIEHVQSTGATGLPLGLAYEARAYIALYQSDGTRYERYSDLTEAEFTRHKNPALSARLHRLKREAQHRQLGPTQQVLQRAGGGNAGLTVLKSRLISART